MLHPVAIKRLLLLIAGVTMLSACGGAEQTTPEAQPMTAKLRWYWLGSASLGDHIASPQPQNYWLEINGDRATFQADCNHGSAKAEATHEGRMWVTGAATARVACPRGSLESTYLKQLGQISGTEQRGDVLRIELSQYGDAMFFARDPAARFSSYRCEGGESMVLIATARKLNIWLGDRYRIMTEEQNNQLSVQDTGRTLSLAESGEALASNCRKMVPR